jgi:hypothetical protein
VASWMETEDLGGRIGLESEGKRKGVTAVVAGGVGAPYSPRPG